MRLSRRKKKWLLKVTPRLNEFRWSKAWWRWHYEFDCDAFYQRLP